MSRPPACILLRSIHFGTYRRPQGCGNTVVLIEHNRRLWTRADWLIELGPRAGEFGGEVLWEGPGKDAPFGRVNQRHLRSGQGKNDRLINCSIRTQEC